MAIKKKTKTSKKKKASWTHDEVMNRIIALAKTFTVRRASDCFLASLSTNNESWRSVLRAYAVAACFPKHKHEPTRTYSGDDCGTCDMPKTKTSEHAWGIQPIAIVEALEAVGAEHPKPTARDYEIMNGILNVARVEKQKALDKKAHRAEVEKGIQPLLPRMHRFARKDLLETLGWCSIFATPEEPGFFERFIAFDNRGRGQGDWESPFGLWTPRHGINLKAQRHFFPQKEINVVPEVAPPPLPEKKKEETFPNAHPLLARVLLSLPAKDRSKLGVLHLGGPPPKVPMKLLGKLGVRWRDILAKKLPAEQLPRFKRALGKGQGSYMAAFELATQGDLPTEVVGTFLLAESRANPLAMLRGAFYAVAKVLGDETAAFVAEVDTDLIRTEFEIITKRALPNDARIVFRAPKQKLWIAELPKKKYLLAGTLCREPVWHIADRDEVLSMIPDTSFEAAVKAVRT